VPPAGASGMNTINENCLFLFKRKQFTCLPMLNIIYRILVVISVYLVFGLLLQHVYASTNDNIDPYQSQHGSVWLMPANGTDGGNYIEALQLQTDVDYEVNGSIARARVKQQFKNSSVLWAEGIYVFPLPEQAAVDHFRLFIGERIIEGQVKERVAAKKKYEQAKSSGKKASLIEQQRPNVFTTSLANIAPGEVIKVEFEFQQVLDFKDERYRLRFPMVIGPRYITGHDTNQGTYQNTTEAAFDKTSVYTQTDALNKNNNPTHIHVLLDAGVSLYDLKSVYHHIDIIQTSETRYSISTTGEAIMANRDFELVWKPQLNNRPQLSAFSESNVKEGGDTSNYTMVTLLPPDLDSLQQRIQARDVVFVIDTSGSMAGTSIEQARASLITAIDRLSSIDRFNIIWFNDDTHSLFPKTVSATPDNMKFAKRFIEKLEAGGGTEMIPAMKLALSGQDTFSRFRQVIFITDGNISNESELFNIIDHQLGNSRLFTIGIGSAPNAYFMRKAAQQGRGTFTYIGDINEVHEKTTALFKKIETPALINIRLEIDDNDAGDEYEVFPKTIPDLYAGDTASILIRGKNTPDSITIKGDTGNNEWQQRALLKTTSQNGIRIAWAREKIAALMDQHREAENDSERMTIQQEVTETALKHHLVSRYTSMVAVDITPVNDSSMLYRERVKNNLPHGWKNTSSANGLMLAQTATSSRFNLLLAMIFFLAATFLYRWKYR
jgi:Ca-activated chloride channel homolog